MSPAIPFPSSRTRSPTPARELRSRTERAEVVPFPTPKPPEPPASKPHPDLGRALGEAFVALSLWPDDAILRAPMILRDMGQALREG